MVRRRKLVNLELNAEARHKQQAQAENKTNGEVSDPLKYQTLPQQELDQSDGAVQQPKLAEQVVVTTKLPDKLVIPAEQATTSATKPAQQLSILNRPKRSIAARAPRYEDEFAPIQAKHSKVVKKSSTPTNKPSLSDYHVFRQGATLYVIDRVTGKKETASTLGPKWLVLKRQFLEVEAKQKQETHKTNGEVSEPSDAGQHLEPAEQASATANQFDKPAKQATTSVSKPPEAQAESQTNGEVPEAVETSQQESDHPSDAEKQLELAEQADMTTTNRDAPSCVLAEQPDQPQQSQTTPTLHYEDGLPLVQPKQTKALKRTHPKTRKLPEFKKPITALKHEWKSMIVKGLPVQCRNYERCHFQCTSLTDMEYHYMKCGTNTTVYNCKCGKFYCSKGSFEQHTYRCSEVFKCSHCGKNFQNYTFLVNHTAQCQMAAGTNAAAKLQGYQISMITKLFHTCPVCRDVFVSADHFSRHKTIMHSSSSSITWAPPVTTITAAATLAPVTTSTVTTAAAIICTAPPTVTTDASVSMDSTVTMTPTPITNVTTMMTTMASVMPMASISMSPVVTTTTVSAPPSISDCTMTTTSETTSDTGSMITNTAVATVTTAATTVMTSSVSMTTATPAVKTTTDDSIILDDDDVDVPGCVHEPPATVDLLKMTEEQYDLLKQGWEEKSHTGTAIDCPNFKKCYYSCYTASRMERHFLNCVRGNTYVCPCGYSFRYKFGYVRHKCPCNRIIFCEQCDKKYYSKDGYELQVGPRLYYYCDTCGESYINQLDDLGKKDFVTLYDKRLHWAALKDSKTLSQEHDTSPGQTASEETTMSQQGHDISQEDDMMYSEDMSVEPNLSEDHDMAGEHDTDHRLHECNVSNEAEGHDTLQGQDRSKEDSFSQTQELDIPHGCDTHQEDNALEDHNRLHGTLQGHDTPEQSSCQVSSVGGPPSQCNSLVNIISTSQQNCSVIPSTLDTTLTQDFLPLEVTSTSTPQQSTPASFPLHEKRTNLIPSSQVTNSAIIPSTPHNGHLASYTGNDSVFLECNDRLETTANSNKSSGGTPGENSATGENPGESTVTGDGTKSDRRARRKKPYNLDKLPSHHRSMVLRLWRKELRENGHLECPMYEYCGCRLKTIAGMQQHYRLCGSIPCPLCNKTFTITSKFNAHYIMEHNKPPAIEQATNRNVTYTTSGISPDLGEEFKGYLKKVRKVNGPLPLWLRQKIQDSLPNRGSVSGYIPVASSNTPQSHISQPEPSEDNQTATTTTTHTTMTSSATPTKIAASNVSNSSSQDQTVSIVSSTSTSAVTIITPSAVQTSVAPTGVISAAQTSATPTSLTVQVSATPTSSTAQISATPTSSTVQISATPTSPTAHISATPTSSSVQISATPTTSSTAQIPATPTNIASSAAHISVTPISTTLMSAPNSDTSTSIISSITQTSTTHTCVTSSTTQISAKPTSVILTDSNQSVTTTTCTPATPITGSEGAQQGEELPSSSLHDEQPAIVAWTAGQKRSCNDDGNNGDDTEKVAKKCRSNLPPGENPSTSEYTCNTCGKKYQSKPFFLEHVDNCGKEWRCQTCKQQFTSKSRLKTHEEGCKLNLRCRFCGRRFMIKHHVAEHEARCEVMSQCKACGREFRSQSGLQNHQTRCTKAGGLPYYFCEKCGKVYLTQDELVEHHSATHNKTPQQPQFSQSGGPAENSINQGITQGDEDTSVNGPSPSGEEALAMGEVVSNKNGSFSMDGDLEHNRRQLEMRLMFSYWRAELQLNGCIRCPMYKFCGCECNSVNGMRYHYTRCGTVACPCCDRTFTTIGRFHTHFMDSHKGQLQANKRFLDNRIKKVVPSKDIQDVAAKVVKDAIAAKVVKDAVAVANDEVLVSRREKYKNKVQPSPSKCSNTKPSVTKSKRSASKRVAVDQYQDSHDAINDLDDISNQDYEVSNQDWSAPDHKWQTRSRTTKAYRQDWGRLAPKNKESYTASTSSAARIRPWLKHKTTSRVKQVRLQASRKRQAEELAQKRHAEEKEVQKKLAQAKQAQAKRAQAREKVTQGQEKLGNANRVKERLLQEKLMQEKLNAQKTLTQPHPPVSVPYHLASPIQSASALPTIQQQSAGSSRAYFTKVLYARLKAQLDGVPVSNDFPPEPPTRSPILQATPISPELLQQSSQKTSPLHLPLILRRSQPTPTSTQPLQQNAIPASQLSPLVYPRYPPYISLQRAPSQEGAPPQEGTLSGVNDTMEDSPQSAHTSPATVSDDEHPPALTVPSPSLEGYAMEEVNINVQANINRTCTDPETISRYNRNTVSVISNKKSTTVTKNGNMSPTVHDVIHDHPYVPRHMIHDEYYVPEVNFSYKTPPPTNQPELLVISIPRSSYHTIPSTPTSHDEEDEEAAKQPLNVIPTNTSSILTTNRNDDE
ncbi:uncharacterized protein [Dysidea avara]|uniref:uncharacterized protein isoform X3 n=1 Tax=Dysidea avara TaxID=196820 RepID=UPI00331D9F79